MLRGASSALSRSADGVGVLLVGGLLTLLTWVITPVWVGSVLAFPPLVVLAPLALAPAFVRRGYLVRVVAGAGATGNRDGAPPFVAWNELYRDGLKSALLSALLLAPLALLFAAVALAGVAVGTGPVDLSPAVEIVERALGQGGVPAVVAAAGGLLTVVTAGYLLAFAYVRPAALAAFAASGRLRDALRPGRVAAVAGSGTYATAWTVAVAALGAGYALAAPFVPLVVGVAFVFVVRVVAHALYGRGAAEAIEFAVAEPAGATGPTAPAESLASGDRVPGSPSARSAPTPGRSDSTPGRPEPAPDRLDGGFRRSVREAPPAIQTGRTVPLGDAGDDTADEAGDPTDTGGFEWNVEPDDRTTTPTDGDDADRSSPAAGGFEWDVGVDPEDKS